MADSCADITSPGRTPTRPLSTHLPHALTRAGRAPAHPPYTSRSQAIRMSHIHYDGPFPLGHAPTMPNMSPYTSFNSEKEKMVRKEEDLAEARKYAADAMTTASTARKGVKTAEKEYKLSKENYQRRLRVERDVERLYRKRGVHPPLQGVTALLPGALPVDSRPSSPTSHVSGVSSGSSDSHFAPIGPPVPMPRTRSQHETPRSSYTMPAIPLTSYPYPLCFLPTGPTPYYPYGTPEFSPHIGSAVMRNVGLKTSINSPRISGSPVFEL